MPGKISISGWQSILRITCIFWLIAKVISYKVWLADRLFPVVPVFDFLEYTPRFIHAILFLISIICLVAVIFRPNAKNLLYVLFTAEIMTTLLDYTRWQPWEYQYLFVLFIFITSGGNDSSIKSKLMLLVSAIYFYSGLQKMNEGFLLQVWDKMLLMSFLKIPHSIRSNDWLFHTGYILGLLEIMAGIGLLAARSRRASAMLLIAMHIFNIVWLGPVGLWYNEIVWPWNILMILYLYALFFKASAHHRTTELLSRGNAIIITFWWLLPALNFFGLWDNYLSSSLYSGKLPLMAFCLEKETAEKELKPYVKTEDRYNFCEGMSLIKVQSWAMDELKVPPYPEIRIYRKMKHILTKRYPGSNAYLYYYRQHDRYEL